MSFYHLLVDVDSKIPNLALMKVSQHFKNKGEEVRLYRVEQDPMPEGQFFTVWVSCIFTWNRPLAKYLAKRFSARSVRVRIGGSGVSLKTVLPPEIEFLSPDYSLYGDDRAVGFARRGCIRKCDWCVVPLKEGKLGPYTPLSRWVPDGFSKVLLLDNEFAAVPEEFEVLDTCKEHGWKLSITQGYDLRCLTEEKAKRLAENKPWDNEFKERRLYCAWDVFGIEPYVRRGIELLLKAGFRGRDIMVYLLAGKNTSHLQDYYRFHVVWKEYKVLPYLMRYNRRKDDPFLNAFTRYVNRGPGSYRNHSLVQHMEHRKGTRGLVQEAQELMDHVESGRPVPKNVPYNMPAMETLYA